MPYLVGNLDGVDSRVVTELRKIQEAMNGVVDGVVLNTLYAAPKKLRDGLVVKADGTTWNPGAGSGVYVYRDAAWHLLG